MPLASASFIGRSSRRPPFRHQYALSYACYDRRNVMPLPFFLVGIIGKSAAGAVAKGLAAKSSAAGAKALLGSHGHHKLAQKLAGEVANKLTDEVVDAAFAKKKGRRED
jgi:hypothetical protein